MKAAGGGCGGAPLCSLQFETRPTLAALDHNSTTAKKCKQKWLLAIACCKTGELLKYDFVPDCSVELQIKALQELKGQFDAADNRLLVPP